MELHLHKGRAFLIGICLIAFIFICIGTASNSWVKLETSSQYGEIVNENGLWKTCKTGNGCHDYTANSDWLKACRAMSIISCLAVLAGFGLSLVAYVESRVKGYMIGTCCIISAISMVITLIIFLTKNEWTEKFKYSYSWSFVLSWIGVLLSLLSAIWATVMSRYSS